MAAPYDIGLVLETDARWLHQSYSAFTNSLKIFSRLTKPTKGRVPYSGNIYVRPTGLAQRLREPWRTAYDVPVRIMTESCGFEPLSIGGGWLVDEHLFRLLLDLEIHKAQRLRYSVSIVCFTIDGSDTENVEASTASSIAANVASRLRGTDAVATWTQGLLFFLLVDAETTHLPSILRRLTAPFQAAFWSAGGSSYPRNAIRAEDMLRQAFDLLTLARNEGGNRLYVAP